MEQVVWKLYNLPEQLRILANGLPACKPSLIADLLWQPYHVDLCPDKILKVINEKKRFREITVAECTKQDGQV
jgi:hypothetical protein